MQLSPLSSWRPSFALLVLRTGTQPVTSSSTCSPFREPSPFHPLSFLSLLVFPSPFLSTHHPHFLLRPLLSSILHFTILPSRFLSPPVSPSVLSSLLSLLTFVHACYCAAAACHAAAFGVATQLAHPQSAVALVHVVPTCPETAGHPLHVGPTSPPPSSQAHR